MNLKSRTLLIIVTRGSSTFEQLLGKTYVIETFSKFRLGKKVFGNFLLLLLETIKKMCFAYVFGNIFFL